MLDVYPYARTRPFLDVIPSRQRFGAQAVLRPRAQLPSLAQPQRSPKRPLAIPSSPLPQASSRYAPLLRNRLPSTGPVSLLPVASV